MGEQRKLIYYACQESFMNHGASLGVWLICPSLILESTYWKTLEHDQAQ
jgi:hypothetical protein